MSTKARIKDFFLSSRLRIAAFILVLGILPSAIFSYVFYNYYQTRTVQTDVTDLITNGQVLIKQVVSTGYLATGESEQVEELLVALSLNYSGRIMLVNDSLTIVKDTYGVDEGKTIIWSNVIETFQGSSTYLYDDENDYLVVTVPITEDGSDEVFGVLIINKSMTYIDTNLEYFFSLLSIMLIITVILVLVLTIILSGWFVRPLRQLDTEIHDIERGVSQEVSIAGSTTEAKRVSLGINSVLSKMRQIDESRQEFVSNVSHELKTPLTSMKVLADSLNGMTDAPVELYQEFMSDIANEIERETSIINDLLSMVRMDKAKVDLNITQLSMNELVESILKRLSPIAQLQNIELVFESFRPVVIDVDEVKITLAITNLVENAIKYNNEGGWVHVSLNSDHNYCYIKVEDSGMGIPEESVDHIFERFYRVDKSHSREIGGTGLGLAITKSAILLHDGEIRVQSMLGEGTVFSVRLPLKHSVRREEN